MATGSAGSIALSCLTRSQPAMSSRSTSTTARPRRCRRASRKASSPRAVGYALNRAWRRKPATRLAAANRVAGFLLHARFRACPTARGLDALRLARRHRLGLAVVDVDLLDMAGCDLVRQLRAIEPALPVAMTTGDYRPTTEVEARQLGIVEYIHKPVDLRRLGLVIARIFAADAELRLALGAPGPGG